LIGQSLNIRICITEKEKEKVETLDVRITDVTEQSGEVPHEVTTEQLGICEHLGTVTTCEHRDITYLIHTNTGFHLFSQFVLTLMSMQTFFS